MTCVSKVESGLENLVRNLGKKRWLLSGSGYGKKCITGLSDRLNIRTEGDEHMKDSFLQSVFTEHQHEKIQLGI